ncbi:hypothetical protein BDB00DRAFT_314186 [Zychaea mexicana]|uniref:uncharacterized protein n=1 Tax=Zychaea mexicana TaxID=64656 RepID=UPI0022FE068A|nr:uncharacterized protein BDB00DRAFT_314186 [Zychaea mexicana]KAI9494390.1 hypothetical protein BDB00DRAFT_314186 [Zychaea mexicana]
MASIFFEDYHFPSELYNRNGKDFSTPIRTLLDFTPHIIQNLPKDTKEQEPIQPAKDRSFEFMAENTTTKQQNEEKKNDTSSVNYLRYAEGFARFLADCCIEYAVLSSKHQKDAQNRSDSREEGPFRPQKRAFQSYFSSSSSSSSQQQNQRENRTRSTTDTTTHNDTNNNNNDDDQQVKSKQKDNKERSKGGNDATVSTAAKSAAAIGALTFSIYSTYQASVGYGDITLQNQVELLLEHVEANLRSTRIWTEERVKLDDSVPELITHDMNRLRQLVDCLYRLDSRREKKIETAGWGMGIVGGLSALGGVAMGSAAIVTGGAAAVFGAVLVAVASRGSNQSTKNIRTLVEAQVHQLLGELKRDHPLRTEMLGSMAVKSEQEAFEFVPSRAAEAAAAATTTTQSQQQHIDVTQEGAKLNERIKVEATL